MSANHSKSSAFDIFDDICDGIHIWEREKSWDTERPELSSCLIETVFVWIPSAFLWLSIPYLVYDIVRSNKNSIQWNLYNKSRLLISLCLSVASVVDLSLCLLRRFQWEDSPTTAHLISLSIYSITRIVLCLVFYWQRIAGIQCSGIVWIYLLFETVLGALSVTTYSSATIRQKHEFILFLIQYSLSVLLFIFCCFVDRLPTNTNSHKIDGQSRVCPKQTASFPSRLIFWWITGLILKGWRNPLTIDDLWNVRDEDRCKMVFGHFNKFWKNTEYICPEDHVLTELVKGVKCLSISNSDQNQQKPRKTSLLLTILKAFWFSFLIPNLLKLIADISQLTNPMIMKLLMAFIIEKDVPNWHGYFYAVLLIVINVLHSLILAYHAQRMSALGMRIRTCLVSALYRKSLVLSNHSKKETTSGEIVNLMAVDSQCFIEMLPLVCCLWTTPVQIAVSIYLLYNEIGVSVFGGLGLIIASVSLNALLTTYVKDIQRKQMKLKDQRLKQMNESLNGIKVLKLNGWEKAFIKNVLDIRQKELKLIGKIGFLSTFMVVIINCTPIFASVVTFTIYLLSNVENHLNAEKAFVSIALFNLLRIPLIKIPDLLNRMIMTSVSVKRLDKYLNLSELSTYVTRSVERKEVVRIENASFTWERVEDVEKGAKPTLETINFKALKGKFVAIIGNVGSGKSSLLYALLGEMEKCCGSVNISGDAQIAYVPQQAWIQNATLKDNILFGKDLDEKRYERVISACALKQDLLTLADGDNTEIGENGINLSGGQKQRVSLARAVYSDADLYLIDDPLSAVDSRVGQHIMDEVLSSRTGLLHNKTRILVTNSLLVLPDVDSIVVLKNGKINEFGSYEHLMTQKGVFSELITQYTTNNTSDHHSDSAGTCNELRHRTSKTPVLDTDGKDGSKSGLVRAELLVTGNVSFDVYIKFAKSMSLYWTVGILLGYGVTHTVNIGSSFWLSYWTESTEKRSNSYWLGIYTMFGIMQAISIGYGMASIIAGTLLSSQSLHQKLLNSIMHAPMHFFDTTPVGRIINRFSKDIDVLDFVELTLRILINCYFQALAILVTISYQTPIFIAVLLPMMACYYIIQRIYVTSSRQLKRLESITRSTILCHFSETINGVSTIRAFNASERFIHTCDERVDRNQMCFYPNAVANCWLSVRLEFIANCVIFFAALLAVISKDSLSGGNIGLSIAYALNITSVLNSGVKKLAEMENHMVSVERINEYISVESEAEWHSSNTPADDWPQEGRVEFIDYGTRYRPGLELVVKGIDLNVEKGQKIGIVGRTGAGKSSLTLALFRIIEAAFGRIVIDGIDISTIGLQELRSRLTIITQDPVLFAGTIRSNLDPFVQHSDEKIWSALEHSHLKEFVKTCDSGIDYKVSERGENLSVGQRQLICLGRALLRNTNIIILDEATAAVDLETDALIQITIRSEFKRCTVLTIAHRLNTIMDSDRVLVLDDGRVVEFDSPGNLLMSKRSRFYSLAKNARLV